MNNEPVDFNPEFTPEHFIIAIDEKYSELKGKEDRLSLKWGHFSRGMNVQIREYIESLPEKSQIRERYHYTQIYWSCKSRLLDLHMKHKLLGKGKIKKESKMAKDIKSMILTGKFLKPTSEDHRIASFLNRL
jgi:hypothetical protein